MPTRFGFDLRGVNSDKRGYFTGEHDGRMQVSQLSSCDLAPALPRGDISGRLHSPLAGAKERVKGNHDISNQGDRIRDGNALESFGEQSHYRRKDRSPTIAITSSEPPMLVFFTTLLGIETDNADPWNQKW